MITLLLLTLIFALAAFAIPAPWREAIAIICVLLLGFLWLHWTGAIGPGGRWI